MNAAAVRLSTAATSSRSQSSSRRSDLAPAVPAGSLRTRAISHLHDERQDDRAAVEGFAQVAPQRLANFLFHFERVRPRLGRDRTERPDDDFARLLEIALLLI